MERTSVSLRIRPDTKERLERLSRAIRKPQSQIVEAAIQDYLDLNEWQVAEIERGLLEVEEGRLVSQEELLAKWESKVANSLD